MSENQQEKSEDKKRFEGVLPDEIIVAEDPEKKQRDFSEKMAYFEAIQKIDTEGYPFFMRLVTLFIGILLFCWSIIIGVVELAIVFLAAICLFNSEPLNQYMREYWQILCKMSAYSLSLFVATLAPSFGLGILALYLTMKGENLENSLMSRLVKSRAKFK